MDIHQICILLTIVTGAFSLDCYQCNFEGPLSQIPSNCKEPDVTTFVVTCALPTEACIEDARWRGGLIRMVRGCHNSANVNVGSTRSICSPTLDSCGYARFCDINLCNYEVTPESVVPALSCRTCNSATDDFCRDQPHLASSVSCLPEKQQLYCVSTFNGSELTRGCHASNTTLWQGCAFRGNAVECFCAEDNCNIVLSDAIPTTHSPPTTVESGAFSPVSSVWLLTLSALYLALT